jgi:uncharacterized membrane protein
VGDLCVASGISILTAIGTFLIELGTFAKAVAGPAMAVAIGHALKAPPLVLFSLVAVGWSANSLGGAGGPLAVFFMAVIATELGKVVSKETPVDIIVTQFITILAGCVFLWLLQNTLE